MCTTYVYIAVCDCVCVIVVQYCPVSLPCSVMKAAYHLVKPASVSSLFGLSTALKLVAFFV